MKVTRKQLRKIIREEKTKVLKEQRAPDLRHPQTGENMLLMLNDIVGKLLDQGMDELELAEELRGIADDVADSARMYEQ